MRFYNVVGFRTFLAASIFSMLSADLVRADFLITGATKNVAAGNTAIVSFSISDPNQDQDTLAGFQLQLQISGSSGNSGVLQFSPVNPVYMQVDPFNDPNYVFSGNSFDQSPPATPFWFSVSPDGSVATGGDSTADGSSISFSTNPSYLLAMVRIDATNAVAGDTYQIAATSFQDANGNNIPYSSTSAAITIAPSVAPAPSSLVLLGIGSLSGLLYSWGRTRRKALLRRYANV